MTSNASPALPVESELLFDRCHGLLTHAIENARRVIVHLEDLGLLRSDTGMAILEEAESTFDSLTEAKAELFRVTDGLVAAGPEKVLSDR
jgi:hypothetical protein